MRKYILLVEDDADIRATLDEFLQDEGFDVVSVANGAEALAHLAANPPPRLILLDLHMPVMDGRTFRERQKATPAIASIPVAIFSAQPRQLLTGVDADAVLAKPVDVDELLETIKKYC